MATDFAGKIAHDADQRGIAGLRLPVRQVRMEQQIGAPADCETAAPRDRLGRRAGERDCTRENEGNLARVRVPASTAVGARLLFALEPRATSRRSRRRRQIGRGR